MAVRKESGAWARMRDLLKSWPDAPFIERIEVAATTGFPDLLWTGQDGLAGRIELKHVKTATWNGTVNLRPAQTVHLRRLAARNGLAGVVAFVVMHDAWYYWPAQPDAEWAVKMRSAPLVCPHLRYANTRHGLYAMIRAWRHERRVIVGEFEEPMPEALPRTNAPVEAASVIRSDDPAPRARE
jgi:hypothetical protein